MEARYPQTVARGRPYVSRCRKQREREQLTRLLASSSAPPTLASRPQPTAQNAGLDSHAAIIRPMSSRVDGFDRVVPNENPVRICSLNFA